MMKILSRLRRERDRKIVALHRAGCSMNEICRIEHVSKTTVFFAINGRSKKGVARTSERKRIKRVLNNPALASRK